MRFKYFEIIFVISAILTSCSENPTQIKALHSPDYKTPIVSGLRITSYSPYVIAIWRKPFDTDQKDIYNNQQGNSTYSSMPINSFLSCPYPNPADGSVSIRFNVASKSVVSCWIVAATLPENALSTKTQYFNSLLPSPTGYAITTFLYEEIKQAGVYSILWNNKSLPAGFYRIYLQVNETLFWRDALLYHKPSDIPYDLMQVLPDNFPLFF